MERNIPDVRDIFGRYTADSSNKAKQELRSYDYSPRSRRRYDYMEDYENHTSNHSYHVPENRSNISSGNKNSRNRPSNFDDFSEPLKQNKKTDDSQKNANSKSKDSAHYSNRTLTERDIRHLERHLSMKKTIRKQISRNLAQAFVDDPELVLKDSTNPVTKNINKVSNDRTFTLTRAKVSKSEQNVLDLLKDNEPDSGHCSTDNPNSSDDDTQEQTKQRHHIKTPDIQCSNNRVVPPENRSKMEQPCKDEGKFSFWKMFSVKNRGKR
ncbi:hypothetical protein X975_07695, partial [Stegodyphus mimosarum]